MLQRSSAPKHLLEHPTESWISVKGLGQRAMLLLEVGQAVDHLQQWVTSSGARGPLSFVLVYATMIVATIPAAPLTMAAGALFGSVSGLVLSSIGATLGRAVSFLLARYFARDAAYRWLSKSERLRQLQELIGKQGAATVVLTRALPLFPINILNYAFGLTRINLSTFLFWSWVSTLPATVIYVTGADVLAQAATRGQIPWLLLTALAVGVAGLGILIALARKKSNRAKFS